MLRSINSLFLVTSNPGAGVQNCFCLRRQIAPCSFLGDFKKKGTVEEKVQREKSWQDTARSPPWRSSRCWPVHPRTAKTMAKTMARTMARERNASVPAAQQTLNASKGSLSVFAVGRVARPSAARTTKSMGHKFCSILSASKAYRRRTCGNVKTNNATLLVLPNPKSPRPSHAGALFHRRKWTGAGKPGPGPPHPGPPGPPCPPGHPGPPEMVCKPEFWRFCAFRIPGTTHPPPPPHARGARSWSTVVRCSSPCAHPESLAFMPCINTPSLNCWCIICGGARPLNSQRRSTDLTKR